jgi:hypothetical protein
MMLSTRGFPGFAGVAQLLKENEKGFNVRLYAGDAAATPKLPQLAGPKAVEGLLVTDVSAGGRRLLRCCFTTCTCCCAGVMAT